MHPQISIITVCYNAASCIERTLRSVKVQDYPHIEYIIIDGASTDNTLSLVEEIVPFAKVYSGKDKGIYDAMNKGIAQATGDYLWFVNAGDAIYSPQTTSALVSEACSDALPDVIYGDTMLIDPQGKQIGLRRLRPPKHLDANSFKDGMLVCHQSFLARRAIAPTYDLSYRFSADVDWCIRVLQSAKRTVFIDAPLSLYLNEGTTTANHRASLYERFRIMVRHYGWLTTLCRHLKFLFVKER